MGKIAQRIFEIMENIKVSLVVTVLNEENTINLFLDSVYNQVKKPNEIIIVDGMSSDKTVEIIKKHKVNKIKKVKIYRKKGNISFGRNFAIKKSTGKIIAITDAGCILKKDWLKNIIKPFKDESVDVVAGYYEGLPKNNFQRSLIPYVLLMPDKINKNFLPASRSMALKKPIFESVGRFNEKLNHGEDYDLAKRLKKMGAKIVFQKNAVVGWIPRDNIFSAYKMFYKYAYGDIVAGNIRTKVILIIVRYTILSVIVFFNFYFSALAFLLLFCILAYFVWSIYKNYKYVRHKSAFLYLPLIQITSDIAVISGTILGIIKKIWVIQK